MKYQTETKDDPLELIGCAQLARCPPVSLREFSELRKLPRMWWLFKNAMEPVLGTPWSLGDPFGVQLRISSPAAFRLNLADIVKPLMDAFITALRYYDGNQLDDIADRVATLLERPVQNVRSLLCDDRNSLLGPYRVPHLRGNGLQWSPADHLLTSGEIIREISADDQPTVVSGCFFRASSKVKKTELAR